MKFPVVFVNWIDASTMHGWQDDSGVNEVADLTRKLCLTVGFLVKENPESVVIAQSLDGEMSPCNLVCIPRVALKRVRRIPIAGYPSP